MDEQQDRSLLKDTFNAVADGYDHPALRFFPASSARLASFLGLRGDEHVLDVATGTGNAALALARHLPEGRVTGVDFSSAMLDQARRKAEAAGLRNVEFLEGDMQALGFPKASFDAATCAFGIFFVEDMEAQLSRIADTVRGGGRVAITSFAPSYFHPLKEMFFDRISRYGVPTPPQTWRKISDETGCINLFKDAGLGDIVVKQENVGYMLARAEDWWAIVWNAGLRRLVTQLSPEDRERFRQEHLEEIESLKTADGIRLDVDVLFTIGTRLA